MRRKLKVISTISALLVCICMLMIGVYAAQSISFTAVGKITFVSDVVYADITRTVYGNKETVAPQVFGLDGKQHVVNYFNIDNVTTRTGITNNGDGTLTVSGEYYITSAKTLQQLCPELKVGETVTILGETGGQKFIYLTAHGKTWSFGKSLTIEEIHLKSTVAFYTLSSTDTSSKTISNLQIVKTEDYNNKLKGAGENGADLFVPYNENNFASVQRKNLFDYKTELKNVSGNALQGDGSVKFTQSSATRTTLLSWTPAEKDVKRVVVSATMKNDHSTNGETIYFEIKYKDGGSVTSANCTNCNNTYITFKAYSEPNREVASVDWVSIAAGTTYIKDVQIEEGVEQTEYEEYQAPIIVEKEYLTENKTIEGNQLNFIDASTDIIVQFEIENLSNDRGIKITVKDLLAKVTGEAIAKKIMVKVGDQALRAYDPNQSDSNLEVLELVCTDKSTTNNHRAVIQIVFSVNEANVGAQINYNYIINMVNVPAETEAA